MNDLTETTTSDSQEFQKIYLIYAGTSLCTAETEIKGTLQTRRRMGGTKMVVFLVVVLGYEYQQCSLEFCRERDVWLAQAHIGKRDHFSKFLMQN